MYDQRGWIDLVRCCQSHLRHRCSELGSSSEWYSLHRHSHRNTWRSFRNNSTCILARTIPCNTWRGPVRVCGCPFVYRVHCNCIMLTHINTCKTWTCSPTSRRWSVGREDPSSTIFRWILFWRWFSDGKSRSLLRSYQCIDYCLSSSMDWNWQWHHHLGSSDRQ